MKILLAVDGSAYTKRMLTYIGTHGDWLSSKHRYTAIHCAVAVPHRAAAFMDSAQVSALYAEDAKLVLAPVRKFLGNQRVEATYCTASDRQRRTSPSWHSRESSIS